MSESIVIDPDAQHAVLEGAAPNLAADPDTPIALRLENGERVCVPASALTQQEDGTYRLALRLTQLQQGSKNQVMIPLLEEQVNVRKHQVETGRVRVIKHVETTQKTIDEPLLQEHVEIERLPVGRIVDAPVSTRQEGETLIIPVLEEVLVVEKRLMLKEEIHVMRKQTTVRDPQQVSIRSEHITVEREAEESKEPLPDTTTQDIKSS